MVFVSKADNNCSLSLNGVNDTLTITYPEVVLLNASCYSGNINVTLNGSSVVAMSNHSLSVGYYNLTIVSGANQNFSNANLSRFLTINRNSSAVNLSVNGTFGDFRINVSTANFSAEKVRGELNISLYINESFFVSANDSFLNETNMTARGSYKINLTHPSSQNYTYSSVTLIILVVY